MRERERRGEGREERRGVKRGGEIRGEKGEGKGERGRGEGGERKEKK